MFKVRAVKTIFLFFFKMGVKSKKTRFFLILSFFPVFILGIMKGIDIFNPGFLRDLVYVIGEMMVQLYFLLIIQLLALFYGSSVISEEIEDKTIVYLTSCPVSKSLFLLGKFLAYFTIPIILVSLGLVTTFIIYFIIFSFNAPFFLYIRILLRLLGLVILYIIIYSSFFTFLGVLIKKPIIVCFIFIFGWENIVRYFPGKVQWFTFTYYLRPMMPSFNYRWNTPLFAIYQLQPPSAIESIFIIFFLSVLFLTLTVVIFWKKEYILSDHD